MTYRQLLAAIERAQELVTEREYARNNLRIAETTGETGSPGYWESEVLEYNRKLDEEIETD